MHPTALIVTLQMDPAAAERFTRSRQAHFPAHRNWLAAHITFFHALPVEALDDVLRDAADLAGRTEAFPMAVDRVLFLGQGVAYGISSAPALRLRGELAARWEALLGRQDRAWHGRLHVTVQNKVEPAVARALHAGLQREFEPHDIAATGLQVWYYVGGPWRHIETYPFPETAPAADPGGRRA